jgi:hypothetical protein
MRWSMPAERRQVDAIPWVFKGIDLVEYEGISPPALRNESSTRRVTLAFQVLLDPTELCNDGPASETVAWEQQDS